MWSRINYEGKIYLLRCRREHDDFTILLTDCSQLWIQHLSYLDLVQRCKELNPLIETTDEKYVNLILDMFKTQNPEISLITTNGSSKLLCMKSKLFGFLFNFEINLNAADIHVFQAEVINPLLFLIHEMQQKNQILVDLLKKKDIEVKQYQLEGAQLFRTSVVTKPFEESGFEKECALARIEENICQEPLAVMVDDVLKLWGSVENKVADIKKQNMKSEPLSLPEQAEIPLSFEPYPIEKVDDPQVQFHNNLVDPAESNIKEEVICNIDPAESNIKEEKQDISFHVPDKKRKKLSKKLLNL